MKLFAANIVCAIGTAVGLSTPCWAQTQFHNIKSDKVSASCGAWVDVVVTFPKPEGRKVAAMVPVWDDVHNVGELTEIKTEFSEGIHRVSGRLRGPPPLPPTGAHGALCRLPGTNLPMGEFNTGSALIWVWYVSMPE